MNFFKKHFSKPEKAITTYADFWAWFQSRQDEFLKAVANPEIIEDQFFKHIGAKLQPINPNLRFLAGMAGDNVGELIITPEGIIKDIVFAEELVAAAPKLPNWKFTALKPAHGGNFILGMNGFEFNTEKLAFFAEEDKDYPDEVRLVIVCDDYDPQDEQTVLQGVYIMMDNFLGEYNVVTKIDHMTVCPKSRAKSDLIPLKKLNEYLDWRESEFVEKYRGIRYDTENDTYAIFQAELDNGMPLVAAINTTLIEWDAKASHPWILQVEIEYKGSGELGMPDAKTSELLQEFEDLISKALKDAEGYLNVGRQTVNNCRDILFACNDFRTPSKVMLRLVASYSGPLKINFGLFKDKYWRTFEKFRQSKHV